MFFAREPIIINIDRIQVKPLAMLVVGIRVNNGDTYFFRMEATESFLSIDISSAFRAAFKKQGDISPNALSYTPLSAEWYAEEQMFSNGEISTKTIATGTIEDVHRGGRSEYLRYTGASSPESNLTNKPQGEIVGVEDRYILPRVTDSVIYEASTLLSSANVYVDDRKSMCFAFINSYGLLESASAMTMENKSYSVKTTQYSRVGEASLKPQPDFTTIKSGGYAEWSAASGYNTSDWTEWWATEFAMSEKHWLLHEGIWIPVIVTPEETMTIYDKAKGELQSISFAVKSTIRGKI